MELKITDHDGESYLYSANCIAEYIKEQAFVAFYDGAQVNTFANKGERMSGRVR